MARARQRSWRCPWERFRPASETVDEREENMFLFLFRVGELDIEEGGVWVPLRMVSSDVIKWTRSRASFSSSSVYSSKGSRFERTVPEKRTGS